MGINHFFAKTKIIFLLYLQRLKVYFSLKIIKARPKKNEVDDEFFQIVYLFAWKNIYVSRQFDIDSIDTLKYHQTQLF